MENVVVKINTKNIFKHNATSRWKKFVNVELQQSIIMCTLCDIINTCSVSMVDMCITGDRRLIENIWIVIRCICCLIHQRHSYTNRCTYRQTNRLTGQTEWQTAVPKMWWCKVIKLLSQVCQTQRCRGHTDRDRQGRQTAVPEHACSRSSSSSVYLFNKV